jgi:hypothetical protein
LSLIVIDVSGIIIDRFGILSDNAGSTPFANQLQKLFYKHLTNNTITASKLLKHWHGVHFFLVFYTLTLVVAALKAQPVLIKQQK